MHREIGGERLCSALVDIERDGATFRFRQKTGVEPFTSNDPDTERVWWREAGVNQNLTFPVQPDPISGMHCWHQRVHVTPAGGDDRYGDIFVDTDRADEVFREWMEKTRPGPGPGNLRRPLWLNRPMHPTAAAYEL